jgi:hypothetical protein
MLDAHPQLAIPAETGFIPTVAALGTGRRARRAFWQTVTGLATWPDLSVCRAVFWRRLLAIEPFTVSAGVRCFYEMYAGQRHKRRWGDKTPIFGQHLTVIQQVVPEAHFVHLIRDGRDVALSLRGLWFAPGDTWTSLAEHWRGHVSRTRAQGAACGQYLEVRYEDLVTDTRAVLKRICRFLELPWSPAMESYHRTSRRRLSEVQTRYQENGTVLITQAQRLHLHRLTQSSPDPSRIGQWRQALDPGARAAFEDVAGDLLGELGYQVGCRDSEQGGRAFRRLGAPEVDVQLQQELPVEGPVIAAA